MSKASFWRGFLPLLATLSIAPISFQVDMAMIAKLGAGSPAAYALLARISLLDAVLVAAVGVVGSVIVAKAQDRDSRSRIVAQLWTVAFAVGLCACAVGCAAYPPALRLIGGTPEVVALALSALGWHLAAIPFRILSGVGLFILFATERGRIALCWKSFEVGLKAAGAYALIYPLGFGFAGCFVAGFGAAVAGAAATFGVVCTDRDAAPRLPAWSFARGVLSDAMWEASRMLSPQLFVLASLALFAAPWLGRFEFGARRFLRRRTDPRPVSFHAIRSAHTLSRHAPCRTRRERRLRCGSRRCCARACRSQSSPPRFCCFAATGSEPRSISAKDAGGRPLSTPSLCRCRSAMRRMSCVARCKPAAASSMRRRPMDSPLSLSRCH